MAQKTSGTLVALGTAAVTAIYLTGYMATASASPSVDATQLPIVATPATLATAAAVVNTPVPTWTSARASIATAPATRTPAQGAYKDGSYTGTGNSRRGGFDVAVTVHGGRITDVQIMRAFTQYPASRVAALPGQVVARQSARVDNVSGATYSAQAFQQAVAAALARATA